MFNKTVGYIFCLNALLFFFQAVTKHIYPPLLLPLREAFQVDYARAGLLVTLVFLGYALARFPSGVMVDRWGCCKIILVGSLAMALSFLAVALAFDFYSMALFTFILGVSSGIYVTAGYTLAVRIGTRSRATTATAAFESFGLLSGILSPFIVTAFVLYLNWHWLFFVLGLMLLVGTVLFYRQRIVCCNLEQALTESPANEDNIGEQTRPGSMLRTLLSDMVGSLAIFREPSLKRFLIWSTLVGGLGAISWTGASAFVPMFLVEERGYSFDRANSMFATIAFACLLTKVGVGWIADRFGSRPVLFGNLLLAVVLIIALTLAQLHWQLLVVFALLGVVCGNTNTIINAYVLQKMPQRYQGTGFGLFCTTYTVIYSLGPFLTGLMSEVVGLRGAIQISAVGAAVAVVLVLLYRSFNYGWSSPHA